jgi:hypothetical protein
MQENMGTDMGDSQSPISLGVGAQAFLFHGI